MKRTLMLGSTVAIAMMLGASAMRVSARTSDTTEIEALELLSHNYCRVAIGREIYIVRIVHRNIFPGLSCYRIDWRQTSLNAMFSVVGYP